MMHSSTLSATGGVDDAAVARGQAHTSFSHLKADEDDGRGDSTWPRPPRPPALGAQLPAPAFVVPCLPGPAAGLLPSSPLEARRRSPQPPPTPTMQPHLREWLPDPNSNGEGDISATDQASSSSDDPQSGRSANFSFAFSNLSSSLATSANSPVVSLPPWWAGTDARALLQGGSTNGMTVLVDRYLLLKQVEGSNLRRCIEASSGREYVCKVVPNSPTGRALLSAHYRVEGSPFINPVKEVITANSLTYLLFPLCSTDLHSYIRSRKRLKEHHARHLFHQIVSAVHISHSKGIVLRDVKLRKFVFTSESRLDIKLESLEDAVVLEDEDDDLLSDKHGCPAYVSPEIQKCNTRYSGRAADMWGLGVILYTMLVGRYPFHGQEHSGLFAQIRRGHFSLPDSLSSRAKCLIRCLLRKEPEDRLTTEDVLIHPWLTHVGYRERTKPAAPTSSSSSSSPGGISGGKRGLDLTDQTVPDIPSKREKLSEECQDL